MTCSKSPGSPQFDLDQDTGQELRADSGAHRFGVGKPSAVHGVKGVPVTQIGQVDVDLKDVGGSKTGTCKLREAILERIFSLLYEVSAANAPVRCDADLPGDHDKFVGPNAQNR